MDVAKAFEFYEGVIRGLDPLVLEAESSGLINPVNDNTLDGATVVNQGKLNWYSGRLVGAGGAVLLNEGVYETNDGGPHHECEGTCTGYYTGMLTANDLLETFKEYSFGESAEHEAEMFSGSATLVNEGEITDPEATCGEGKWVEVQWPTEGKGSYDDPCTYYANFIPPEHPEPEPEEEAEAVPHPGVGSSITEGEDCKTSPAENEHCYALVESVNVESPAGFLGSSVEIDPTCLTTNGDNKNFTDAEQWAVFTTKSQHKEGIEDWAEGGITRGDSETITWPHYFIADVRALEGEPTYFQHNDTEPVALNQYFKDEIWYVKTSQWEVWLPGYHMISTPQPEFAKHLEAGTENTANDVSAEAKIRNMEYETTKKGTWRKGWTAEHQEMKEAVYPLPPHNSGVARVTSPTTAEVAFDFPC